MPPKRKSRLMPPVKKTNMKSSAAPSSAASGSRRSSLNDIAQQSDFDDEPAKRMSTDSGSPNGSFGNNTPMNGTQTPSLDDPVPEATLQLSKTAGKRRRASDDSTQSSKARSNGVLTRTQSDVSEQQPRRKKRKTTDAPADSADQPPELTDASTAPNSPEQVPDVAINLNLQNVLPANGDAPVKIPKRLPGRRRQPHPDTNVEVDLRRQLTLKTSYRSVAKVLKGVLDELAQRTNKNLQDDPDYHKQCPEYKPLMAGLDQKRDTQLDYLAAWRSERMEQLERVRIAEKQIQEHQYINRFEDLRDDCLQRCYVRMKQIEREWKAEQNDATDDEDNVLPPTYTDGATQGVDERLSSKFASRSRAYVEADRELKDDVRRKRFAQARVVFVEKEDDADDSIEELSGGFARFAGPDRTEAVAHYNISSLADAAHDVERTPSPQIQLPQVQVIPNDQATMLMLLADLSVAEPTRASRVTGSGEAREEATKPQETVPSLLEQQLAGRLSLVPAPADWPSALPSQAAHTSPLRTTEPVLGYLQHASRPEPNGAKPLDPEVFEKPTPARTTHRIMDMLNDDQDVPVSRARESQHPVQEQNPPSTPSKRNNGIKHETPSRGGAARLENIVNQSEQSEQTEHLVDQQLMDALSGPVPQASEPPSPVRPNMMIWQQSSLPPPSVPPPTSKQLASFSSFTVSGEPSTAIPWGTESIWACHHTPESVCFVTTQTTWPTAIGTDQLPFCSLRSGPTAVSVKAPVSGTYSKLSTNLTPSSRASSTGAIWSHLPITISACVRSATWFLPGTASPTVKCYLIPTPQDPPIWWPTHPPCKHGAPATLEPGDAIWSAGYSARLLTTTEPSTGVATSTTTAKPK
ncbi:hypothetical protein N0V95_001589 [Ascochyta clinopodiicola]|nr:hypothetical protein N0V95_001589 [Ascochyta clinopodiicola]